MDFATRDRYRHVVERIAKRVRISEQSVALSAIELAEAIAARKDGDERARHVGFYFIDKGLAELERDVGIRRSTSEFFRRALGPFPFSFYAGTIALITILVAGKLLWLAFDSGLHGEMLGLLAIVVILAASHFATAIVNWLAT